jgi:hypothetical protein
MQFPVVTGSNLQRKKLDLPGDFEGGLNWDPPLTSDARTRQTDRSSQQGLIFRAVAFQKDG